MTKVFKRWFFVTLLCTVGAQLFAQKNIIIENVEKWCRGAVNEAHLMPFKEGYRYDLQKLIPHLTTAGLLYYQFTCPDMIGGGEFGSFIGRDKLDEELVVRSAQCSALMPMMQFSVALWRVLSKQNLTAVKMAIDLRAKYTPYIIQLVKQAAKTGEHIARSMEYDFFNQGFVDVKEHFMLGRKYLVAPIVSKDNRKIVYLPKDIWQSDAGKRIKGPVTIEIDVAADVLPVFELVKS